MSNEPISGNGSLGAGEFAVVVYECTECSYRTINKSNLNSHLKTKCTSGTVRKRSGIVRVLDIEPAAGPTTSTPLSTVALEQNNKLKLREAMDGRVPITSADERVTFFLYTDEGRAVMLDIFDKVSIVDQFLYFIKFYTGNAAPPNCRSVARYGSKGGSLVIVRELGLTFPSLRRCVIVDLLIELYASFKFIMTQPIFRDDVPTRLRDAAKLLAIKLDQPINRARRRTLTLKEILDTRRGDDEVVNVLIDNFPLCLSFVQN
jgi:hypothetical protein